MTLSRALITVNTVAALAMASGACAPTMRATVSPEQGTPALSELWQQPTNIASRDLFNGVGGATLRPRGQFQFESRDTTGASPGFDVKDAQGRKWSVKLGVEAQPEVVVSRLLWAVGFHQPPVYYLNAWTLTGGEFAGRQPAGRFRLAQAGRKVVDAWSWYENPFVGSRPYAVLIAANVLVNNWDLKSTNNKLYELSQPANGVRRQYVVRDLGASLGKSSYPDMFKLAPGLDRLAGGTKSDIDGFEAQDFILEVEGDRVKFDYDGSRGEILKSVKVADVKWACDLFARLSERQLRDAFRAAAYDDALTTRFVRKLRQKIAQGQALPAR